MSHQLSIGATKIKNLLVWWSQHVMQSSHVFFLVRQILGIVGLQSDIESIFNLVGLITNL
jgi:hypothetical protein